MSGSTAKIIRNMLYIEKTCIIDSNGNPYPRKGYRKTKENWKRLNQGDRAKLREKILVDSLMFDRKKIKRIQSRLPRLIRPTEIKKQFKQIQKADYKEVKTGGAVLKKIKNFFKRAKEV